MPDSTFSKQTQRTVDLRQSEGYNMTQMDTKIYKQQNAFINALCFINSSVTKVSNLATPN